MENMEDFRIFALWVGMARPMKGSDCGAGPVRVRKDYVKDWLGEPSTACQQIRLRSGGKSASLCVLLCLSPGYRACRDGSKLRESTNR